jgi:hypothetical protein
MLFRSAIRKFGKNKLIEVRQKKNRPLSFTWLIRDAGILTDEDKTIAHDVRKMRNCAVHFQNSLSFSEVGTGLDPRWLGNAPEDAVKEILQRDKELRAYYETIFPSHEELAEKEALEFIKQRREIMNAKAISRGKEAFKAGKSLPDPMESAQRLEEENVLECLKWCRGLLGNPNYHIP